MSIDFFKPIVPQEKMHQNFSEMIKIPEDTIRDGFNKWAEGFVDRDNKIVREFQTTFNSTFWEIFLHRLFIELGFSVDYSHSSPDYSVKKDSYEFTVEAVISNNAQSGIPEWDLESKFAPSSDFTAMNMSAMLRHLNSLHKKHKKYLDSYGEQLHVKGKPFVIALGSYDQPNFWLEFDRAIRAVLYDYYIDEKGDVDAPVIDPGETPAKKIGKIVTQSGSEVELGLFNDERMKEVSAVIFSCTATHGKLRAFSPMPNAVTAFSGVRTGSMGEPVGFHMVGDEYSEKIQDGVFVFHNPFAEFPLPINLFNSDGIMQIYYSHLEKSLSILGVNDFLVSRFNHTMRVKK